MSDRTSAETLSELEQWVLGNSLKLEITPKVRYILTNLPDMKDEIEFQGYTLDIANPTKLLDTLGEIEQEEYFGDLLTEISKETTLSPDAIAGLSILVQRMNAYENKFVENEVWAKDSIEAEFLKTLTVYLEAEHNTHMNMLNGALGVLILPDYKHERFQRTVTDVVQILDEDRPVY